MTAPNSPRKGLQKMALNTAAQTTRGHSTIARPAKGTHATQELGCPTKSRISCRHPLRSIKGLFASATKLIIGVSTINPSNPTRIHPGISTNLSQSHREKIPRSDSS